MCRTASTVGGVMYNSLVLLGPTACGKTAVAVQLASLLDGEIISADSRQVYRGLDIGSGKDLNEFTLAEVDGSVKTVPYHLIDVVSLPEEYNVYSFQRDAYEAFSLIQSHNKLPVIVGGTGMYVDALIRGYDLVQVPTNHQLRQELAGKSMEELTEILKSLRNGVLHNHTDTEERHRLLRAIEIALYSQEQGKNPQKENMNRPHISPVIFGTTFPREELRKRIKLRLRSRLKEGMIEEVQSIHDKGISWEQLERLGLEYRFISLFLQNKIATEQELFNQLFIAIGQFAKRQETWFRGMERKGVKIHWLTPGTKEQRVEEALRCIKTLDL